MDGHLLRIAERDDYPQLAIWLVKISQPPAQHCLHTWSGQDPDDLLQQLQGYWDDSELCYNQAEGQEVVGFAVVSVEGNRSTGELQFFAVRNDHRRQGYGRRLMLSAIGWLFDQAGVSRISLNVGQDQVYARRLYESAGFRLRFTGIGLHRLLPLTRSDLSTDRSGQLR